MDFSAWFEVYLGGRWYTFDARHNTPRIGRILMARGRDATDVALSTSFGPTRLAGFKVHHRRGGGLALAAVLRPSEQVRGQASSERWWRVWQGLLQPSGELAEPRQCCRLASGFQAGGDRAANWRKLSSALTVEWSRNRRCLRSAILAPIKFAPRGSWARRTAISM